VQSYAAPVQLSSPMTSAPAKKWEAYGGGYDPLDRRAPAKKWEPYEGGYDPNNRRVAAFSSLPAESNETPAQSHSVSASVVAPMTSAPTKKWEPYEGGYDPLRRHAPAKKWEPYGGGYDPLDRRAPAASNVPAQSHATPEQSYAAPAAAPIMSAPAKKWEPCTYIYGLIARVCTYADMFSANDVHAYENVYTCLHMSTHTHIADGGG